MSNIQKFDIDTFKESVKYQEVLNKYVKGGAAGKQKSWANKADKEGAFLELTEGLPQPLIDAIRAEMGDLGRLSYENFIKAFNTAATKNVDPAVAANMIPDVTKEIDKSSKKLKGLSETFVVNLRIMLNN